MFPWVCCEGHCGSRVSVMRATTSAVRQACLQCMLNSARAVPGLWFCLCSSWTGSEGIDEEVSSWSLIFEDDVVLMASSGWDLQQLLRQIVAEYAPLNLRPWISAGKSGLLLAQGEELKYVRGLSGWTWETGCDALTYRRNSGFGRSGGDVLGMTNWEEEATMYWRVYISWLAWELRICAIHQLQYYCICCLNNMWFHLIECIAQTEQKRTQRVHAYTTRCTPLHERIYSSLWFSLLKYSYNSPTIQDKGVKMPCTTFICRLYL